MSTLTIEIIYSNGDMIRKTVNFSTVIQSTSIYSDMKSYIQSEYEDYSNYYIYYQGQMIYSKAQEDIETTLIELVN